jgi:1-acyl-sn-glycerol-3-phosphate acyltransferase
MPRKCMEETLAAFREMCRIPGTDIPLPKSPGYTVLLTTIPHLLRTIFQYRYRGIHRVRRKGAVIIAGNHTSHVDPFGVIPGIRRRTHYLAKDAHFSKAFTAFIMRTTGQIRTHRESGAADALSRAADVLEAGLSMGIFPEGTRSRRTEAPFLSRGKTGVARLAASFPDVPVHPTAITGARDVMAPGDKMIRFWKRVGISYGEAITWNDWIIAPAGGNQSESDLLAIIDAPAEEQRAALGELYRKFTDQLIASLAALGAP